MEECKDILLELGFSTRRSEEKAPDLAEALRKRGLFKEEKLEEKDINEVITSPGKKKKKK